MRRVKGASVLTSFSNMPGGFRAGRTLEARQGSGPILWLARKNANRFVPLREGTRTRIDVEWDRPRLAPLTHSHTHSRRSRSVAN